MVRGRGQNRIGAWRHFRACGLDGSARNGTVVADNDGVGMMDRSDPVEAWRQVLAGGGDGLLPDERRAVESWLAGLSAGDAAGEPAPAGLAEALQAQAFAAALIAGGAMDAALAALRLTVAGFERFARPGTPERLDALRALATALLRTDRLAEAEATVDRMAELAQGLKAGRQGWQAVVLYHRAAIADRRGDKAEAPDLLRRALALAERDFGPVGGWSDIIRGALADSLSFLNRDDELTQLCRDSARLFESDPAALRPWLARLAELLGAGGPTPELVAVHRGLAETGTRLCPPAEQAEDLVGLGRVLAEAGQPDQALAPLERAASLAQEPGLRASARFWLAEAMARTEDGDPEQIHELYSAAVEGFTMAAGAADDATLYARQALGRFIWSMGLLEEAEQVLAAACAEAEAVASPLAAGLAESLVRLRRRRLSVREKGRLFAWGLAQGRETHGEDRLSAALAGLRAVAEQAEAPAQRHRIWAETAILLAAVGHEDQALAIIEGALAAPEASAERARVQAQVAAERLKGGDEDAARQVIGQACAQAEAAGGAALPDLIEALAAGCGRAALALAEPLIPESARPRLREMMIADRVARAELDAALALFDSWNGPALAAGTVAALARLAADEDHGAEALRLARLLADTPHDRDAVAVMLRAGAESEALAAIGGLDSGLPFIEGVALAARHHALKGDRAVFVRRATEAFTHLADHVLAAEAVALPLRRIAEGALELMGKDQALVWAAGLLPDALVGGFAAAMGRALEDKRGLGQGGAGPESGVALEQGRSLAALGRWDDAVTAVAGLAEAAAMIAACIQVAELATAAGDPEAAARALKSAFVRLAEADAQCGRRLGEAVAGLLPAHWRGAFADAALTKASGMDDLAAAASYVVAAAHAAIVAVEGD